MDPIVAFAGVNCYQYVNNNPLMNIDCLGLWDMPALYLLQSPIGKMIVDRTLSEMKNYAHAFYLESGSNIASELMLAGSLLVTVPNANTLSTRLYLHHVFGRGKKFTLSASDVIAVLDYKDLQTEIVKIMNNVSTHDKPHKGCCIDFSGRVGGLSENKFGGG